MYDRRRILRGNVGTVPSNAKSTLEKGGGRRTGMMLQQKKEESVGDCDDEL